MDDLGVPLFKETSIYTLPATNSSPLKMDGLEDDMSFWDGPISGAFAVSFREGTGCLIGIMVDWKFP